MSQILVTSEDLQTLSSQVAAGSSQIQEQLGQLQGQVSAVVGSNWAGQASGQFQTLYDEWNKSAAGLKDALDGIARLLNNAGIQYQDTENAIRASMA